MPAQKKPYAAGATRIAFDTMNLNMGATLCLFAAWVAVRLLAYAPVYLLFAQKKEEISPLYYLFSSLAFGVFLVLPSRFYINARIRRLVGGTHYSPVFSDRGVETSRRPISVLEGKGTYPGYTHCLRMAVKRFGRGLLWGLPCFALVGGWCYGFWGMSFNKFGPIVKKISGFFGGEYYDLGVAVWMLAILIAAIVFFLGWNRGLTTDFTRISGREDSRVFAVSAEVRKANIKRLRALTLSQFPFVLPSLIAWLAVLFLYARPSLSWQGSLMMLVTQVMTLMRTPIPGGTMSALLLIALCLYAPLAFFRKMRAAAVIYSLYSERSKAKSGQSHAA